MYVIDICRNVSAPHFEGKFKKKGILYFKNSRIQNYFMVSRDSNYEEFTIFLELQILPT